MTLKVKVVMIILSHIKITSSNMTGHIIKGHVAKITDFPHSAFLIIGFNSNRGDGYFSCGSSIVNQDILLTAGHCFIKCKRNIKAVALFGHERHEKGIAANVLAVKKHKKYVERYLSNDIALVLLKKDLKFGKKVRRVGFMKQAPIVKVATVAGWGKTDERSSYLSEVLMSLQQDIMLGPTCLFILNNPEGTFCAESKPGQGYPSKADSGSALVVFKFIQIGLVSYTVPNVSKRTTVYTNVSYFYDWIKTNSEIIYCTLKQKVILPGHSLRDQSVIYMEDTQKT